MRKTGRLGFWTATICLVFVTAFCCAGTVLSRTDLKRKEIEGYYRDKERELVSGTREFLNVRGFANSGIMLTHTIEPDGGRMYTLTVHHGEIDRMNEEERQRLLAELEGFTYESAGCSFCPEFYAKFYIEE